jgi:phage/plasmid-associated DNA primase
MVALQDLASPVAAFVRGCRQADAAHTVTVDELYAGWRSSAEANGHPKTTKQAFGRDLRAAVPRVGVVRRREAEERYRLYRGIGLRERS